MQLFGAEGKLADLHLEADALACPYAVSRSNTLRRFRARACPTWALFTPLQCTVSLSNCHPPLKRPEEILSELRYCQVSLPSRSHDDGLIEIGFLSWRNSRKAVCLCPIQRLNPFSFNFMARWGGWFRVTMYLRR